MGNGNKVEFLVAICALVTSVVAVFIAWDQAQVMRLQQRAEVWPLLQIDQITDVGGGTASYSLRIQNAGVGPALIENYAASIPGDPDATELVAFSDYMMGEELSGGVRAAQSLNRRVIRQGDAVEAFRITWPTLKRMSGHCKNASMYSRSRMRLPQSFSFVTAHFWRIVGWSSRKMQPVRTKLTTAMEHLIRREPMPPNKALHRSNKRTRPMKFTLSWLKEYLINQRTTR